MLTIFGVKERDLWQYDDVTMTFLTLWLKIASCESHWQKQAHRRQHPGTPLITSSVLLKINQLVWCGLPSSNNSALWRINRIADTYWSPTWSPWLLIVMLENDFSVLPQPRQLTFWSFLREQRCILYKFNFKCKIRKGQHDRCLLLLCNIM